ncbi:Uridylate kinase [Mycoplasma wenyonii str. Massachusetts]|uniref:Uridylate kinase n=1 Tax=Mycoplasma wenyonii (strain Massachusetts) TaxID=1197325 RepID=I6YAC4_MYCWM|nr:uridylate kinase [Mycoplasma wenyonii]AFN64896.1 Uridylate kinase [Mycoplasma wenyonii str. Massachusetts]
MSGKTRLLLKLSGGALASEGDAFDEDKLQDLAKQLKELSKLYSLGIVVGGGNLWRGREGRLGFLKSNERDYIGMVSTIINCFVLQKALESEGIKAKLFSAIEVERITDRYTLSEIESSLGGGEIALFAGGVGEPCYSTDSAAIIRAIEIGAKEVFIGKEGVKGIYDKDPNVFEDAVFLSKVSYDYLITKDLRVIDQSSIKLARDNKLRLVLFDQEAENSFVKAVKGEIEFSEVV